MLPHLAATFFRDRHESHARSNELCPQTLIPLAGAGNKKAIELALQAVGNGSYSQEHHDHGYLMKDCTRYTSGSALDSIGGNNSHSCTTTDASGFASYIMNLGSADGPIWSTDDFKSSSRTSPFGSWANLQPGDIIIYYPTFTEDDAEYYSEERSHHVLVYIGKPSHDVKLSWMDRLGGYTFQALKDGSPWTPSSESGPLSTAEYIAAGLGAYNSSDGEITFEVSTYITLKAGQPVFVDCTRMDQTGNIYLRGGYAPDDNYFYYADESFIPMLSSTTAKYRYHPNYTVN